MHFAEVKRENKQRDGGFQVVPFAAKCARQSCQSAYPRSHGQVGSFNVARANQIRIGIAEPWFFDSALQFGRRVSRRAFRHSSVNLNQLRIVNAGSKAEADCVRVSVHAVTGQLESSRRGFVQLLDKDFRINAGAASKMPSQDRFAVAFDREERPRIALAFIVRVALIPLLATDKPPKLVNLYFSDRYFAEVFKHNLLALLASDSQDFQDSSDMHVAEPRGTANATTFCQTIENAVQRGVRDVQSLNRLHAAFRERAATLAASKARRSILSEIAVRLRGIDVTSWTIHSDRSSFLTRFTVGTSMRLIGLGSHLQCESGYGLLGCYKQSSKSINGLAAGEGFEPSEPEGSADLQSAPIGHSGNPPLIQRTTSSRLCFLRSFRESLNKPAASLSDVLQRRVFEVRSIPLINGFAANLARYNITVSLKTRKSSCDSRERCGVAFHIKSNIRQTAKNLRSIHEIISGTKNVADSFRKACFDFFGYLVTLKQIIHAYRLIFVQQTKQGDYRFSQSGELAIQDDSLFGQLPSFANRLLQSCDVIGWLVSHGGMITDVS